MSAALYMIAANYRSILQMALDEGLESDEELREALLNIRDELSDKVDNVCYVIRALNEQADSLKAEAERLSEKATARSNKAARLKEYLLGNLNAAGVTKVQAAHHTVSVVKGRETVAVTSELAIPSQFWKVETTLKKRDLIDALKRGEAVAGAELTRGEPYLLIK
jgi:uncharacterized coiled-coil DUF342 family protein